MPISRIVTRPTNFQDAGFGTAQYYRNLIVDLDIEYVDGISSGVLEVQTYYRSLHFTELQSGVQLTNDGNGNLQITVAGVTTVIDNFEDGTEATAITGIERTGDTENGTITAAGYETRTVFLEEITYLGGITDDLTDGVNMFGTTGNDSIVGFDTNDVSGRTYDDHLSGGRGDDTLRGGEGNDTYLYTYRYDGNDLIYETDSQNTLFMQFALKDYAQFSRDGADLIMTHNVGDFEYGSVRFDGYYSSTQETATRDNDFGRITFMNGMIDLTSDSLLLNGTMVAETIYGTVEDDAFNAKGGNDTVRGGAGNDTYHFGIADGDDKIVDQDTQNRLALDSTLSRDDMRMVRSLDDLTLEFDGGASIFFEGFFDGLTETSDLADSFGVITFENGDAAIDLNSDPLVFHGTTDTEDFRGTINTDIFIGNGGDDDFWGGTEADTYWFGSIYGGSVSSDYRIFEVDNVNTLRFTSSVTQFDVLFTRSGFDLILNYNDVGDHSILLDNFFDGLTDTAGRDISFGRIEYDNGTVFDLTSDVLTLYGTIEGEDVYGTVDNDILVGQAGDDDLLGGAGDDIYRIDRFSGADRIYDDDLMNTLEVDNTVSPFLATYHRQGFDLLIDFGTSSVLIDNYFDGLTETANRDQSFGRIDFQQNNSVFDLTSDTLTLTGSDASEDLYGTKDEDILIAGLGDDDVLGGGGQDLYKFDIGHGADRLYDGGHQNVIELGTGIAPEDLVFMRQGFDLLIKTTATDSLLIDNFFDSLTQTADRDHTIGRIEFSDSATTIDLNTAQLTLTGTSASEDIYGTVAADILIGLEGDDDLLGGDANDQLIAGLGADDQTGGAGDDRFIFQDVADSTAAATDLIRDFTQTEDRIDLSAIDAKTGVAGSAFTFIGANAFNGTAGLLRVEQSGLTTTIYGDTNGDEVADLVIDLTGLITLQASDFVL